ncbi:ribonuclease HI family protein [Candidatus Uhrbacteria bacterium]|nr:ribonuclease HI family protein [Candidatus Uhrbacteria bacterium]
MNKDHITTYTDGGARGNPGPAALGAVVIDADGKKHKIKKYIGSATNNVAEYQALIAALERAHHLGARHVTCYLDSELIVKQMNREYRVKDPTLGQLFLKVWNIASRFSSISFHHIRREKNKEADTLVNEALDEALRR